MSLGARLQSKSTEYQKLQGDLAVFVDKRTRLDTQLSENEMVKKVLIFFSPPPTLTRATSGVCKPHPKQHSIQACRARPRPPRPYRSPYECRNTAGIHPGRDVRLLDTSLISVSLAA
jgi:hypothetical protein